MVCDGRLFSDGDILNWLGIWWCGDESGGGVVMSGDGVVMKVVWL